MDALHTNAATAKAIGEARAFNLLTVKGNAKTLHALLKALPWADVPATTSTDTRRGRRTTTRTIKVLQAPPWCQSTAPPGRTAAPHDHHQGEEDRRGRLPHL
jgi:hypothetical protein